MELARGDMARRMQEGPVKDDVNVAVRLALVDQDVKLAELEPVIGAVQEVAGNRARGESDTASGHPLAAETWALG